MRITLALIVFFAVLAYIALLLRRAWRAQRVTPSARLAFEANPGGGTGPANSEER